MTVTAGSRGSATPRDKTLRRLVHALEGLVAEGEDFTALPVERILERAEVARSTFYAHFESKGALLRAVGSDVVTQVLDASRGWSGLADDAGRSELRAALGHLLTTYREHGALLAAMSEVSAYDPDVRREFSRILTVGQPALTAHVKRGQRVGSVRADVDPVTTVTWLVWMVERCLYTQVRQASTRELDKHVSAVTHIVWSALYEGAPARPA